MIIQHPDNSTVDIDSIYNKLNNKNEDEASVKRQQNRYFKMFTLHMCIQ